MSPATPQPDHAPDRSDTALLLIDVINDFDFPEAAAMIEAAERAADQIAELKAVAARCGVPAIYVNDNFGRWQSDFAAQIEHCERADSRGRNIVRKLKPAADDYFVLKPMHSGFYATNLEVLLGFLEVKNLILTGFAGNICVLFTANDAYMRRFCVAAPSDCTASNTPRENDFALEQMRAVLKADTRPMADLARNRLRFGESD